MPSSIHSSVRCVNAQHDKLISYIGEHIGGNFFKPHQKQATSLTAELNIDLVFFFSFFVVVVWTGTVSINEDELFVIYGFWF